MEVHAVFVLSAVRSAQVRDTAILTAVAESSFSLTITYGHVCNRLWCVGAQVQYLRCRGEAWATELVKLSAPFVYQWLGSSLCCPRLDQERYVTSSPSAETRRRIGHSDSGNGRWGRSFFLSERRRGSRFTNLCPPTREIIQRAHVLYHEAQNAIWYMLSSPHYPPPRRRRRAIAKKRCGDSAAIS